MVRDHSSFYVHWEVIKIRFDFHYSFSIEANNEPSATKKLLKLIDNRNQDSIGKDLTDENLEIKVNGIRWKPLPLPAKERRKKNVRTVSPTIVRSDEPEDIRATFIHHFNKHHDHPANLAALVIYHISKNISYMVRHVSDEAWRLFSEKGEPTKPFEGGKILATGTTINNFIVKLEIHDFGKSKSHDPNCEWCTNLKDAYELSDRTLKELLDALNLDCAGKIDHEIIDQMATIIEKGGIIGFTFIEQLRGGGTIKEEEEGGGEPEHRVAAPGASAFRAEKDEEAGNYLINSYNSWGGTEDEFTLEQYRVFVPAVNMVFFLKLAGARAKHDIELWADYDGHTRKCASLGLGELKGLIIFPFSSTKRTFPKGVKKKVAVVAFNEHEHGQKTPQKPPVRTKSAQTRKKMPSPKSAHYINIRIVEDLVSGREKTIRVPLAEVPTLIIEMLEYAKEIGHNMHNLLIEPSKTSNLRFFVDNSVINGRFELWRWKNEDCRMVFSDKNIKSFCTATKNWTPE